MIKKRLEAIRGRYYNEKFIELWQLLHIFADKSQEVRSGKSDDEFLLVRRFNIVFEAMIDALLGDADAPQSLIRQSDGKIVDHLFKGDSILGGGGQVYYIGDSKYYKEERHPEGGSLFKQYTYARNIIQQEINWYHSRKSPVVYRDPLTEGYNITPNFFICGFIDREKGFADDSLEADPHDFIINYQFPNRLFDRDTLFLREYNINFLFVLYAYTSKSQSVRTSFKEKAKAIFKEQFTGYVNRHYDFFILKARNAPDEKSLESLVRGKLFWRLNGKVISPYPQGDESHGLLVLGLENPSAKDDVLIEDDPKGTWIAHNRSLAEENTALLLGLEDYFIIKEYRLGTDPYVYYEGTINGVESSRRLVLLDGLEKNLAKYKTETVLFGCYRSKEQLEWILSSRLYNVRYTGNRAGTVFGHNQKTFTASYLVLYDYNDRKEPARCFILGTKHQLLSHKEMVELRYPFGERSSDKDWYFIYHLGDQTGGILPVEDILIAHPEAADGSPLYLHFAEVDAVVNITDDILPKDKKTS